MLAPELYLSTIYEHSFTFRVSFATARGNPHAHQLCPPVRYARIRTNFHADRGNGKCNLLFARPRVYLRHCPLANGIESIAGYTIVCDKRVGTTFALTFFEKFRNDDKKISAIPDVRGALIKMEYK